MGAQFESPMFSGQRTFHLASMTWYPSSMIFHCFQEVLERIEGFFHEHLWSMRSHTTAVFLFFFRRRKGLAYNANLMNAYKDRHVARQHLALARDVNGRKVNEFNRRRSVLVCSSGRPFQVFTKTVLEESGHPTASSGPRWRRTSWRTGTPLACNRCRGLKMSRCGWKPSAEILQSRSCWRACKPPWLFHISTGYHQCQPCPSWSRSKSSRNGLVISDAKIVMIGDEATTDISTRKIQEAHFSSFGFDVSLANSYS